MIGLVEEPQTIAGDLHEQLVASLRLELEEYGGLLCHFEAQEEAILNRKPDLVRELGTRVDQQVETARVSRKKREALARHVAQAAGLPEQTSLKELARFFRPPVRPMVQALTTEVNRLINYIRHRAQRNQMLHSRAMDAIHESLGRVAPESATRTEAPGDKPTLNVASGTARLLGEG